MPADYGQLSRRDKERLRRARRRAGIKPRPPVRGENAAQKAGREEDGSYRLASGRVRDAETRKVRKPITPSAAPIRGDSARGKSRVAPVGRLRDAFEDLQFGRITPAQFGKKVAASGLSEPEKRDFESYSRVRSLQVQRENDSLEQVAGLMVGPELAKLLPGGTPASKIDPKWAAVEAAGILPIGRGASLGLRGVRAVRAGGKAKAAAGLTGRTLKGQEPRMVKYGELETQFPNSPSIGTRYAQRLWDRGSELLAKGVDPLRDSESRIARAAGAALTPLSSRARVPKQTGKLRKQETVRRAAEKQQEIREIKRVGGIFGLRTEPARTATWYFAQLPKEYRNAEGLTLAKGRLQTDLDDLTSGAFSQRITGSIRALRESLNEATGTDRFQILGDIERLRGIEADIPDRIKDVAQEVKKLDRTIARLPHMRISDGPIDAMRALMDDRRDILVRAGKLNPETADARTGLVSRWLGLEPTGEEVFVGHRMARVKRQRPSGLPASVSLGKTMLPEGVAQENTGQLLMTGRARKDLASVVEDWQAAQVYEVHNLAKDELAQMGEKIVGRPKAGYAVLNPKGHTLPRTWKVDDAARAADEGFEPDDVLIADVRDYMANYLAEGEAAITKMMQTAAAAGHLEDLRQVPLDVVKRYYSQLLPTKIHAATPGVKEGASMIAKGVDWTNDVIYGSLIYANPGYIPGNIAANEIMAVLQQGVFHPVNLSRSVQLIGSGLTGRQARVRDLIRAEVGAGMTTSIASDTSPLRKGAELVSDIADEPFRFSSFMHEAARVGVIPKTKAVLTDADYAALEQFLTSQKTRPLLNDVKDRAVQAMIDFNRLGSKERAFAKRALFVWGFLRGALRYPGRFALDHPIRTAAGGTAIYLGQDEIRDRTVDDLPSRMRGTVGVGETQVDGKAYPSVLQTRSFEPTNPPSELIGTAMGDKDARTFLEMAHPGVQALLRVAGREDRFGYDAPSYRESIKENVQGLFPWYERAKDYIDPEASPDPLYPEDTSRLGRLKRDLRVLPIAIDPEVGAEKRRRELSRQGRAPVKKLSERRSELEREELANARKLGLDDLTPEVRIAVDRKAAIATYTDALEKQQSRRKDAQVPPDKKFKLTPRQKAAAALMALRDTMPPAEFDYAFAKAHLDSLKNAGDVEDYLDLIRRDAYSTVLEDWHRHANAAR